MKGGKNMTTRELLTAALALAEGYGHKDLADLLTAAMRQYHDEITQAAALLEGMADERATP